MDLVCLAIYLQAAWEMVREGMPDVARVEILRGYLVSEEVPMEEFVRVYHLNRRWM